MKLEYPKRSHADTKTCLLIGGSKWGVGVNRR